MTTMKTKTHHTVTTTATGHWPWQLLFLLLPQVLLLFLLPSFAGCSPGVSARRLPPIITVTPDRRPHQGHLVIEARLDVSSSYYPSAAFDQAKRSIADAIDDLVQLNSDGATVYIGLIAANSYQSSSIMQVITIPALPADMPKPVQPKMTATDDPYQKALEEKQAYADYEKDLLAWQSTLQEHQRKLTAVKATVKKQTDMLRALHVQPDSIATDLSGALEAASEHMQAAQGQKYLIIASDLMQTTAAQDTGALHLPGVHVKIIDRVCIEADSCEQNDAYWRNVLLKAHATSVSIADPSESQANPTLLP